MDLEKITTSAANGLSLVETEAIVGHKLSSEEKTAFNKTKAAIKLKKRQDEKNSIIPKPKRGTLAVKNDLNLHNLPSLAKRYTKKQIEDIIIRAHGLTSSICAALDCSTLQFYVYLRKRPELKQLQEEARLDFINEAEQVLMDNLHDQDPSIRADAAKYVLNHLGRTQGWGEDRIFGITIDLNEQTKQIKAIFGLSEN